MGMVLALSVAAAESQPQSLNSAVIVGAGVSVLVACVGAYVSISVAVRSNRTERDLAEIAARAEADAMRSETAATITETVAQSNARLIEALQKDNDRLRLVANGCEQSCDLLRRELYDSQDKLHATQVELRTVRVDRDESKRSLVGTLRTIEGLEQEVSDLKEQIP